MKKFAVISGGTLLAGTLLLAATGANAWWGWGDNYYGPWGGGPWYGGYPYGGYGYPYGGYGYPYGGGWGGYPYGGYGYPSWGAAPAVVQPQAPAASSSK